jgi:filamentous hemagglutinin family protein
VGPGAGGAPTVFTGIGPVITTGRGTWPADDHGGGDRARAYAEWTSFDIGADDAFIVSNSTTPNGYIFLNRVTGPTLSTLSGRLLASGGNVWLLNPNGVTVSSTAFIDVGGLLLSTASSVRSGGALIGDGAAFAATAGATNFNFGDANGAVVVQSGARILADIGAITLLSNSIDFGGRARVGGDDANPGDLGLIGARDVSVGFDADLNAYTDLVINVESTAADAVTVRDGASFSGSRTIITAAGMADNQGNILLTDTPAATEVTVVGGDVVLFAARRPAGESVAVVASGAVQPAANDAAPGGIVFGPGSGLRAVSGNVTLDGRVTLQGAASVQAEGGAGEGQVAFNGPVIGVLDGVGALTVSSTGGTLFSADVGVDGALGARLASLTVSGAAVSGAADRLFVDVVGAAIFSAPLGTAARPLVELGVRGNRASFGATNFVDRLAIEVVNGGLSFTNGRALTVGTVRGLDGVVVGDGDIALTTLAGPTGSPASDLILGADLTDVDANNRVTLTSAGSIIQTGGSLTAATLTGGSVGPTVLSSPTNRVDALGGFSADGFLLNDEGGLTVTGAVDGRAGGVTLSTTGALTVGAGVSTTGGEIALTAAGPTADIALNAPVNAGRRRAAAGRRRRGRTERGGDDHGGDAHRALGRGDHADGGAQRHH